MPALIPTDFTPIVTWLGVVESDDRTALAANARDALDLNFDGVAGSVHGGRIRPSCSRVVAQHTKGTPIANERQVSILSEEEMAEIAAGMGLARLDPARLGATIVIRGLPDRMIPFRAVSRDRTGARLQLGGRHHQDKS